MRRSPLWAALLLLAASVVVAARQGSLESDGRRGRRLAAAKASSKCWGQWGSKQRTVLFVADPGTFSNTPENAIYLANLKDSKKLPAGDSGCPEVVTGTIMGQRVAVVTTGIGQDAAAMCVFEVLLRCGSSIKDATYSGTSGWSPQRGGILNAGGDCEGGAANAAGQQNRLGDVCVSPFAVNWSCRKASWTMTAAGEPNQCNYPLQIGDSQDTALFGVCSFSGGPATSSLTLADEIIAAARSEITANQQAARPAVIHNVETDYWSVMQNSTGVSYPQLPANDLPTIWDYKQCMEVSAQYFWSGAPWDMVAREYVADTMNVAGILQANVTRKDVTAVSAMEGVGVAAAFGRYTSLTGARPIPYTVVRGMSNYAVQPVAVTNQTVTNNVGLNSTLWVNGPEIPEDFVNGYAYAIKSASAAVLSMLKERCVAEAGKKAPQLCQFTVTTPNNAGK